MGKGGFSRCRSRSGQSFLWNAFDNFFGENSSNPGVSLVVIHIEGEDVLDAVNIHCSHEARVVSLLARNEVRHN